MKSNNIVLIGMPASGKSTLGVLLAKQLGYDFVDADLLIQRSAGKILQRVLDEDGAEAFAALESGVLCSLSYENTVIATGGSAVYHADAMRHLSEIGHIVYLKIPFSFLERRLGNLAVRGVLRRPGQSLADLFEERRALYEKYAEYTFCETDGERERTMDENIGRLTAEVKALLDRA